MATPYPVNQEKLTFPDDRVSGYIMSGSDYISDLYWVRIAVPSAINPSFKVTKTNESTYTFQLTTTTDWFGSLHNLEKGDLEGRDINIYSFTMPTSWSLHTAKAEIDQGLFTFRAHKDMAVGDEHYVAVKQK